MPVSGVKKDNTPNFKGAADVAFAVSGGIMQWIQNAGFLATFLIQDGIGMTVPRVGAAYLRDKEVTGHYNTQEGLEVLGREGLTGPMMMAMAPAMMLLAAKFGKSTNVNSQLIRRMGNSFKEMISSPDFDKALLKDKNALQEKFCRKTLTEAISETVGKEHVKEEDLAYIVEQLKNYNNVPEKSAIKHLKGLSKKKAYKRLCIQNITDRINSIKMQTSSDLDMLNSLKVGIGKDAKTFGTDKAMDALLRYSDDVIKNNKHLESFTPDDAEKFMDSAIGKRLVTNVSTAAATLGVLSVLPKIYAKSDIAPGARTAMQMRERDLEKELSQENNTEVSFKGKAGGRKPMSALGKFLREKFGDKFADHLEYNGHNFTSTLMAILSVGGLLFPRGMRAVNRAQVDDNGKKDLTELWEILIRDLTSSISVIFAVPMLTRAFVTAYENKTGFVLMHRDRTKTGMKKFTDLINPYSKSHVLENNELEALYSKVDTKEKLINFCKYIDKNNGDLQKIFTKSAHSEAVFNEESFKLNDLSSLNKKEKNSKIIEWLENKVKKADSSFDKSIKDMMHGVQQKAGKAAKSKILSFAKGMNSVPALISTFAISPFLLGWIIPRLTYANTRRIHQKKEDEFLKKLEA